MHIGIDIVSVFREHLMSALAPRKQQAGGLMGCFSGNQNLSKLPSSFPPWIGQRRDTQERYLKTAYSDLTRPPG